MPRKKILPFVPEPADLIKMEFRAKDISAVELGKEMGLTKFAVYKVLNGKSRSSRIREAIARAMGHKPIELWPDYKPERSRKKGGKPDACANI